MFVDDDALQPDATVGDLDRARRGRHESEAQPGVMVAGRSAPPSARVGLTFQVAADVPVRLASATACGRRASSTSTGIEGPVLFTPNHCLHLDNAIILTPPAARHCAGSCPSRRRRHHLRQPGPGRAGVGDRQRLPAPARRRRPQEPRAARSARSTAGFNVLIYPEGKLTVGGPLQPFKAGAGLIAVEGATPIVPVKVRIHRMAMVDLRRLKGPFRGDVEFVIGPPIWFDADTDHATATTRLEAAVAAL